MKKVYIDLGCYDGETIREFLTTHKGQGWEVYGFDPNYHMLEQWQQIQEEFPKENITFDNAIAYNQDGIMQFTIRPDIHVMGSTAMPEKVGFGEGEMIEGHCFDFSAWLKTLERKGVYKKIVVKMDIEGAEFPVIEKMIEDKTIHIPDKLLVEWHDERMSGSFTGRKVQIMRYIGLHNINYEEWR